MQNKIYIVRHGETPWNAEGRMQGQTHNIDLSQTGIEQMHEVGQFINQKAANNTPIAIISTLTRAQHSFNILNKYLKIAPSEAYSLREIQEMNFGIFEGEKKDSIKSHSFFCERKNDKWNTSYPEGESYQDVFLRIRQSLLINIVNANKDKDIVIVAHASINKVIPIILGTTGLTKEKALNIYQKNNEVLVLSKEGMKTITL